MPEEGSLRFQRASDLSPPLAQERSASAADALVGSWLNTKPETTGFTRALIERDDDRVTLRIFGAGKDGAIDWGPVDAEIFANVEEDGVPTSALYASYDLGFMETELQIRNNRGVLVIAQFTRFKDDSGRANWVDREFFYLEGKG